jgi:hypothetical protein
MRGAESEEILEVGQNSRAHPMLKGEVHLPATGRPA